MGMGVGVGMSMARCNWVSLCSCVGIGKWEAKVEGTTQYTELAAWQ